MVVKIECMGIYNKKIMNFLRLVRKIKDDIFVFG